MVDLTSPWMCNVRMARRYSTPLNPNQVSRMMEVRTEVPPTTSPALLRRPKEAQGEIDRGSLYMYLNGWGLACSDLDISTCAFVHTLTCNVDTTPCGYDHLYTY